MTVLAEQADGKIIAGGTTLLPFGLGFQFMVARFFPDGAADTGFAWGGFQTTDFSDLTQWAVNASPNAIAVQADGKVVVAGNSPNISVVARYLPDGSLDTGFGNGGRVLPNPKLLSNGALVSNTFAYSLAIQTDGKVVVGGTGLTRLNPDGSPDFNVPSFGYIGGIDIDDSGNILTGGFQITPLSQGSSECTVNAYTERFLPSGQVDATFANDGVGVDNLGTMTCPLTSTTMTVQSDGKFLVGLSSGAMIVRFNPDGSVDTSFGTDGLLTPTHSSIYGPLTFVQLANGNIYVGSKSNQAEPSVLAYNSNGTPDSTFGNNGNDVESISGLNWYTTASLALHGGGFLLGGSMETPKGLVLSILSFDPQ